MLVYDRFVHLPGSNGGAGSPTTTLAWADRVRIVEAIAREITHKKSESFISKPYGAPTGCQIK